MFEILTSLLPTLIFVSTGIAIVQLVVLIGVVRTLQGQQQSKRIQPTAELQKELTLAQKTIRETATKLDASVTEWYTQLQATIESQLTSSLKTAQESLATEISQLLGKQTNSMNTEFTVMLKELRNTAQTQVQEALAQAHADISQQKQVEISAISAAAQKAVQTVAIKLLGQSLTLQQHHQLAERALEDALSSSKPSQNTEQ